MPDTTEERIVFVETDGTPTGETGEKLASHHADTRLHLAFSCYVFNHAGQLLVTQRALIKKVWPGVWTNSVCGHPAPGEGVVDAIRRRLDYELGMTADDFQLILPDYIYKTPPFNGVIEREFCPVYAARAASDLSPNPDEVEDWRWMSWPDYITALEADAGDIYSWWSKDQLRLLKDQPVIQTFSKA